MSSIWDQASPQLRDLAVYEPGKPIEETARELKVDPSEIIKLASNENPLGPSPKALAAMRAALEAVQLYPDGGGFHLRNALADELGFARENIILGRGNGSSWRDPELRQWESSGHAEREDFEFSA